MGSALEKKVRKLLELRLDGAEFLSSIDVQTVGKSSYLQEISEFYEANTLESRRNLRATLERRSVVVASSVLSSLGDLIEVHMPSSLSYSSLLRGLRAMCKD
jgi:hypothetical protein